MMKRELAMAVESAIMECLFNAQRDPTAEGKWRAQADKLESKFKTDFGRHYSYFLDSYTAPQTEEAR